MDLRDATARLLMEKYALEDTATEEIKKLREEAESLRSTCNYLGQQYQENYAEAQTAAGVINKIMERYPDIDLDALRAEVLAEKEAESAPEGEIIQEG